MIKLTNCNIRGGVTGVKCTHCGETKNILVRNAHMDNTKQTYDGHCFTCGKDFEK